MVGVPMVEMPAEVIPEEDLPRKVRLCEIALRANGHRIMLTYSRMCDFNLASGSEILAEVKKIAQGTYPSNFKKGTSNRRKSELSLNNREYRYLVFVLNEETNWQFAREVEPFSLFKEKGDNPTDLRKYYMNPISFDGSGTPIKPGSEPYKKSMVAFFIARGQCRPPSEGDRFNIHVDINEEDDKYIPVMIDPDVGHPGGSTP
jgi:hypothetical protein